MIQTSVYVFTSALVEISKSIALYLHSDKPVCQVLAIDLCSHGFHVWLHHVDPMETLRSLCQLATSTRKESIAVQNPTQQARLAVLQIASSDTPLFMTTLTADILQPKDTAHRKAVMQLVAFLIKRVSSNAPLI
jgi:WD repeat-containing protein 7